MTQREKLIDIMAGSPVTSIVSYESTRELADYLLANDVVVLPCKIVRILRRLLHPAETIKQMKQAGYKVKDGKK